MLLKKISIESMTYSMENGNEIKKLLKRNCEKNNFPSSDLIMNSASNNNSEKKLSKFIIIYLCNF